MSNSTDSLTSTQISVLLDKFIPQFKEHGVECRISATVFTQKAIHSLEEDQDEVLDRFLYNA